MWVSPNSESFHPPNENAPIGTGIAGYDPEEVAPLFVDAPDNVVLPEEFETVLSAE